MKSKSWLKSTRFYCLAENFLWHMVEVNLAQGWSRTSCTTVSGPIKANMDKLFKLIQNNQNMFLCGLIGQNYNQDSLQAIFTLYTPCISFCYASKFNP